MIRTTLVLSAMVISIAGCLHTGGDATPQPRKAKGVLDLIDPKASQEVNNYSGLVISAQLGRDTSLDEMVAAECAPPPQPKIVAAAALLPIATMVAGWAIDYVISEVSTAAQQRLAEYSGLTSSGLRFGPPEKDGDFYSSTSPPTLGLRCVRLRRIVEHDDGKLKTRTLAAEAIVKVETTPAKDALLITPLRIYFNTPLARTGGSRDSTFGVSVGATFDGLWQAEAATGEGKVARVWSATVASQKIVGINDQGSKDTRRRFYYYNLTSVPADPDNRAVMVPLVPWSTQNKGKGMGTLTLTLAEVGDPPFLLELAAGALKDNGKDIGDFLKAATKKAIEPETAQ